MKYKVYVKDEKTNKAVQKHAFKLGYEWNTEYHNIRHIGAPFLYFEKNKITWSGDEEGGFNYFKKQEHSELTPEEFIRLEITNKEPEKIQMTEDEVRELFQNCSGALYGLFRSNYENEIKLLKQSGYIKKSYLETLKEKYSDYVNSLTNKMDHPSTYNYIKGLKKENERLKNLLTHAND